MSLAVALLIDAVQRLAFPPSAVSVSQLVALSCAQPAQEASGVLSPAVPVLKVQAAKKDAFTSTTEALVVEYMTSLKCASTASRIPVSIRVASVLFATPARIWYAERVPTIAMSAMSDTATSTSTSKEPLYRYPRFNALGVRDLDLNNIMTSFWSSLITHTLGALLSFRRVY